MINLLLHWKHLSKAYPLMKPNILRGFGRIGVSMFLLVPKSESTNQFEFQKGGGIVDGGIEIHTSSLISRSHRHNS